MKFAKNGDEEDLSDISFASDVQLKPYINQIPVYRNTISALPL